MILIFIFLYFSTSYSLKEEWTIHVYTGKERFAGTDSSVFIRMFNSIYGYTHEYELTHNNWLYGSALFPFKDLFEYGGHDRFRISTEKFGFVEKIHVRRDNFPVIRSDWFLDQIIVERNRDSAKFTFKCNCWLQTKQPNVTIPVFSDVFSANKNNASIDNQILVLILIVSIVSIACCIFFIRHYCRTRDYRPVQQSLVIERSYPPSAPPRLDDRGNSSETVQHALQSTDEPPAYRDLFPD